MSTCASYFVVFVFIYITVLQIGSVTSVCCLFPINLE